MIVRRAEPRDLGAVTAIYNHWVRTSAATFDIDAFTEDERRPWFEEHGDDYPLLVAERDGEVVGYACLSRFRTKPAYRHTAETTVYLAEAARGAGLGTALYDALVAEAQRLRYHVLVAGITVPNEASVRLHRRFGFERIGVMHEVGWKFERWHDVEWFELRL
ncbi:MAG TPA: GNAT family N-acetyltransferase [Dehalococcoidia bacterium]|nr:GNAT family N-acetyltransferase [Dehalococcoidia bacterium]